MAEQVVDKHVTKKSSDDDKPFTTKKKTQAELDQEAYMARQYAIVIGELKAAEARNRIRATRLRFSKSHRNEIDQIIAFQPNALSALRFEAFMMNPSSSSQKDKYTSSSSMSSRPTSASTNGLTKDPLTKIERRRVQNLILDDRNLLVNRTD
ncbi:unnamed protein product [Adineta steineri]|uniref:Uncharacterized protein n=1 Tax=Adineta steineri TaxID=433720 RepID=A0A818QHN9_9BILA|nr:unnamed protein product [Adineta steineri]CAF1166330.1 unnamed protein product [Adineta steineri]CAF1221731.1 unnamed protein product [Adineta steineri]CAF3639319.1 unnamed protein product [Adineta steineri]CAF3731393.1 unnamed protein product [Adineta steineri]